MDKKGLGVGQVFVFIVAAITFALIMIFGYKAIGSFVKSGEDVAFVQFKTELESSIKKIYTEYGSVRIKKFTLPAGYEQICFVNLDGDYDPELCKYDAAACTIWEDAQNHPVGITAYDYGEQNVFLKPAPTNVPPIKVYKISIDDPPGELDPQKRKNFICIPIKSSLFTIVLEGKGDKTEISRMPES